MEQIFDVLVRVGGVQLGEITTKHVDVVNHDPSGRVGFVCVARREEVDGRTRMTRNQ